MIYIHSIKLKKELPKTSYLSRLPVIKNLKAMGELTFEKPVTFLVGENGKIIDALHHSDIEKNDRLLLPGATYVFPKKQNKLNPTKISC